MIYRIHLFFKRKIKKTVTTPKVQLRLSILLRYAYLLDDDLPLQAVYDFLLLFRGRFRIDIQRCLNILMPYDFLDHLDIGLVLTEPCTECMTQVMRRKTGDEFRLTLFCLCTLFFHIIISVFSLLY